MRFSYLSKIFAASTLACYLAVFSASVPAWAQNSNESTISSSESEEQNFEQARQKLENASKEAREAVEAAGKAAQQKIDMAVQEAEKKLAEEANWGWLGLLGLIGLFGLAGKGKRREKTVSYQQEAQQGSTN